ncbi:hypothetical protein M5J14_23475 [Lysinibacillus sp. OL1_EC]|uniref:hypothetical protein n=1 Tax=unclassified Lysinibacillus TaxID=2636778 RepID=UPI00187D40CA|nr:MULTISPECIES: hypothetical protein [unclassified Lysinibacillus]MCM0627445.1 hypothetical protein [Lysinibacillus sp. OL1_EC]
MQKIERGVYRYNAGDVNSGWITLYKLREMTAAQREKYDLCRYFNGKKEEQNADLLQ